MPQDTNPQADPVTIRQILVHYRAMIADLVEDRHDHGITTEQLIALDTEAEQAIIALLASTKPEPPTEAEFRENAQYCLGIYDGVNEYDAAIRAVLGKEREG